MFLIQYSFKRRHSNQQIISKYLQRQQIHPEFMHLFWEDCQQADCIRQYVGLALDVFAFLFAFFATFRTTLVCSKAHLEVMPLALNTVACGIIMFLCLTKENYEYNLVIATLEIYTYFFFTFAFGSLLTNLSNKLALILFASVTVLVAIAISVILVFSNQISCDPDINIAIFAIEFVEFAATWYLCRKIKFKVRKHHSQHNVTGTLKQGLLGNEDEYINLRIRQINLLLIAFTISIITSLIQVIFLSTENDQVVCLKDGISYLKAKTAFGLASLYFKDIYQLVPHVFIPIILYIIPKWKGGVQLGVSEIKTEEEALRENSIRKEYEQERGLRDYYGKKITPENSPVLRHRQQ